ncbi:hypothetical protein SBV1_2860012 [Verrucomicrobia bacterium]|nr:hypothetical protein SBV1_2860012 [Verrucomicrobiota bacterium]
MTAHASATRYRLGVRQPFSSSANPYQYLILRHRLSDQRPQPIVLICNSAKPKGITPRLARAPRNAANGTNSRG